jgi:DNA-binding NarL/FixJ family response regulator
MGLLKIAAGYFATRSYFNFDQREYIMKAYNVSSFKEIPLLEMDQVQLVHIYAQKLTMLTKKQRGIFDLLSNGMMVKDIAKHLELAEITVKVIKAQIMVLLGVTTLQEMAVISKCNSCTHLKLHL